MKKFIAMLLTLVMVLSLAGCGGDDPAPATKPSGNNPGNVEPVTGENSQKLEYTLWDLVYDKEAWTYDEDDCYNDDTYSKIMLIIPNDADSYLVNVEIRVSLEDASDFRDYLNSYGFDAYEYAVNNAYELVKVGGVDCLQQTGNYWGEPCQRFFGRVEGAGATVFVEIVGDYEDPRVAQLLAGLTVKLQDVGNVDAPWPWAGEPFSASDASATAGNYTVSSKWLPITDCIVTDETFDHAVAVSGSKAYLLVDGALKQYAYDGNSLVFEADLIDDGDFAGIQTANDGAIWISGFMESLIRYENGTQTASYDGADYVSMHPSGTWGISYFTDPECQKITLSGDTMNTSTIKFSEVESVSTILVDEDYIYVCGRDASTSDHRVFVYGTDGTYKMKLSGEGGDGLGSVTFIAQTTNGFLGLDGNMREILLWTQSGEYIGTIEDGDLFGTYYPWFCGGAKLADGSIMVVMTEDRADESAMELVAFVLKVS